MLSTVPAFPSVRITALPIISVWACANAVMIVDARSFTVDIGDLRNRTQLSRRVFAFERCAGRDKHAAIGCHRELKRSEDTKHGLIESDSKARASRPGSCHRDVGPSQFVRHLNLDSAIGRGFRLPHLALRAKRCRYSGEVWFPSRVKTKGRYLTDSALSCFTWVDLDAAWCRCAWPFYPDRIAYQV